MAGGKPPWKPPNPVKVESRLNALARGNPDPLPSALTIGAGRFSVALLNAIDECLALQESERFRCCDQLLKALPVSSIPEQENATRLTKSQHELIIATHEDTKHRFDQNPLQKSILIRFLQIFPAVIILMSVILLLLDSSILYAIFNADILELKIAYLVSATIISLGLASSILQFPKPLLLMTASTWIFSSFAWAFFFLASIWNPYRPARSATPASEFWSARPASPAVEAHWTSITSWDFLNYVILILFVLCLVFGSYCLYWWKHYKVEK